MKLPSLKKLPLIPVLVAMFLAIGLILFINAYSKKEAFSQFNLWGGKENVIESQYKDSDNDGLQDWQEELYKTDYLNSDTDGDSYLDGEEINSGHNPLVKAPGDTQMFYPLPLGDKYNITKRLLTDNTINAIFDSYLNQKAEYIDAHPQKFSAQSFNTTINQVTVKEMFTRAMIDNYPVFLEEAGDIIQEMPEIFEIKVLDSDINISEDNNQTAIKSYINKVNSIIYTDGVFLKEENLQLTASAFADGDFSKIDVLIKEIEPKVEKVKQIIVPSSWKEIHKEELELIILTRNIFISLRDLSNDPLKAYIALQEIENLPGKWNDLAQEIAELIKNQELNLNP